jgi:hypothetical protein
MREFPKAHTERAYRFCTRIKEALVAFSGKSQDEAVDLINETWKDVGDIESDPILYEETPYYYAMCIAHRDSPGSELWYKDKTKWPPPEGWRTG